MAEFVHDYACCGLTEIDRIMDDPPEVIIKETAQYLGLAPYEDEDRSEEGNCAFFVFTTVLGSYRGNAGKVLERYIRKHKLGTLTKSPVRRNPNSGNKLQSWLWAPNRRNLGRHGRVLAKQARKENGLSSSNCY
jgi:hypothetical protein